MKTAIRHLIQLRLTAVEDIESLVGVISKDNE